MPSIQRQPTIRRDLKPKMQSMAGALGAIGLQCHILLQLQGGSPSGARFFVDTGAMFSIVGLDEANRVGIPAPPNGSPEYDLPGATAAGKATTRVRPGRIRVWWSAQLIGDPFGWPVLFVVGPRPEQRKMPPLLGLGGIVTDCRWTVYGPTNAACDGGYIEFEDTRV